VRRYQRGRNRNERHEYAHSERTSPQPFHLKEKTDPLR
jgi:hypothetical protein